MKRNQLRTVAKLGVVLIVMTVFFSSCSQKGVGCPNNFKVLPTICVNVF